MLKRAILKEEHIFRHRFCFLKILIYIFGRFSPSDHKRLDFLKERIRIIGVSNKCYGRERIERKNSHNGLSVNDVSSLLEVYLVIEKRNLVYKGSDVLNALKRDLCFLHNNLLSVAFSGDRTKQTNFASRRQPHIIRLCGRPSLRVLQVLLY